MDRPNPLLEYTLDRELAAQIISRSVEIIPAKVGILYHQGEPPDDLYFVKSGEVMIMLAAGQKDVMFRAGEGSLLGIAAVINNQPYAMTAKAASDAKVCKLSSEAFNDLFSSQPKMQLAVLQILAAEVRAARQALSELASGR